jgi:hypothetical protein
MTSHKIDTSQVFNCVKIDSFTILIPYENVAIIDSKFDAEYCRLYEGGEYEESNQSGRNFKNSTIPIKSDCGITTRAESLLRMWNGEQRKFIRFVVTAKMLRKDYLKGINKDSIKVIYNYLIDLNIVHFTYDVFLNSYYTDLDLCIDLNLNSNQQVELKNQYKQRILLKKERHIQSLKHKNNLQLNTRPKATPVNPFIKFYNKTEEITTRSETFFNTYLQDYRKSILSGIYRVETTLKNSKHKEKVGIKESRYVSDLMNLTTPRLKLIHNSILQEYINKSIIVRIQSDLTPADVRELNYINLLVSYGLSHYEIVGSAIKGLEGKQLTRARKKVVELLKLANDKERIKANDMQRKHVADALKTLGII